MQVGEMILVKGIEAIGKRTFDEAASLLDNSRGKKSSNWLTQAFDFLGNWFRRGIDYLMSNFGSLITNAAMTLYTFDWAKTDQMIWEDINQTNKLFAEQLGRMGASQIFRGTALGLTKGAKMRYPTLDPVILAEIDEENQDELKQTIQGSLAAIRSGVTRNFLNLAFMSGRSIMGLSPKEYKEPWTLQGVLDKAVEWAQKNLPFNLGNFLEGFKEQAEDDFFDGLVLLGTGVQQQYAMSRAAIRDTQGKNRIVKFYPDRNDSSSFTYVAGTETEIKTAVNSFMLQNAALENKDVGMVVQTTLDTSMKSTMGLRLITIYYYSGENGGSTLPNGKRAKSKTLEIKNVKLTANYDKIRLYCKKISGGPVKVVAHLSDGHQLVGFFASESEGKAYFNPIITNICEGNLVRFSHIPAHENPKLRPSIETFYPASFTMQIRKETLDETKKAFTTQNGKMYKLALKKRIPLNKEKPSDIDNWMTTPFIETTS